MRYRTSRQQVGCWRDFYDIYILSKVQGHNIDTDALAQAIMSTSEKRGSKNLLLGGELIINEIFDSTTMSSHWTRYQKKYSYAGHISWDEIKDQVLKHVMILNTS